MVLKKPCRAFFGLFDSTSVDRIYHFSLVARGFFSLEEGSHEMLLDLVRCRAGGSKGERGAAERGAFALTDFVRIISKAGYL